MVVCEGKGDERPKPVKVIIRPEDIVVARYAANAIGQRRKYESRRDVWGRGFATDALFKGILGEIALAKWLNQRLKRVIVEADTSVRPKGDQGIDFTIFGRTIQVKTETRDRGVVLIRRINERQGIVSLAAELYVSVCVPDEVRTAGYPARISASITGKQRGGEGGTGIWKCPNGTWNEWRVCCMSWRLPGGWQNGTDTLSGQ
jgi:hypothetical protein